MNSTMLSFLTAYVLAGSAIAITGVLVGVHRGLKDSRWPKPDRSKAIWSIAAMLIGCFLIELILARLSFFHGESSNLPTIQYGLIAPILIALVLYWRWPLFQRIVDAVPQKWMVGVQLYRAEGLIFIVLYAMGQLPGAFAKPAGYGDIAVGLLAPIIALLYARRAHALESRLLLAWNLFGIADLIVAVTAGFLTSPSRFQMLALDKPNELISSFPLVMIPVFLVPLSFLLHFASLAKLRRVKLTSSRLSDAAAFQFGVAHIATANQRNHH